jgi:hypothetical protein
MAAECGATYAAVLCTDGRQERPPSLCVHCVVLYMSILCCLPLRGMYGNCGAVLLGPGLLLNALKAVDDWQWPMIADSRTMQSTVPVSEQRRVIETAVLLDCVSVHQQAKCTHNVSLGTSSAASHQQGADSRARQGTAAEA